MTKQSTSGYQLSLQDLEGLSNYLTVTGKLRAEEKLSRISIAGEGNMNVVVRVNTTDRSFILKQSRSYVQKYPTVEAPINRINVEAEFYSLLGNNGVWQKSSPKVLWFDEENRILCLEDLGSSSDFSNIYKKDTDLVKSEISELASLISELHSAGIESEPIENTAMRELNHAHMYVLPLQENNGFDLNSVLPGLQEKTEKFRADGKLKRCAKKLGDIYLEKKGRTLLHGDFYPGSWLRTADGIKLIDPEFSFQGRPEFELGVAIAHLKLAQQSNSIMKDLFVYYHFNKKFDGSLFTKFAGMEIIRRLIGLAQLPLELDLNERLDLLDEAYDLVIHG
ncbi:MAG: phosphotransferase [Flavobacteriales bacterium]